MKIPDQANLIKVAAVVTATPRWVVALLSSEGFSLPDAWKPYWIIFSVISAGGMAIVEGVAFAYVFNAWKRETAQRRANVMLILAVASAMLFVVLLSPSIAASVRGEPLANILSNDALLWLWSAVVAASTIAIVASVGYAQKQTTEAVKKPEAKAEVVTPSEELPKKRKFSDLLPDEIIEISKSTTSEVAGRFGISDRAALDWRKQAAEVLQIQGAK